MNKDYADGLTVKLSPIDGRGCFTTSHFPKGRKIAEYVGERISRREIARRLRGKRRIHICAIDTYWACQPNCTIRIISGHILFFALRDIDPGEELLVDYEVSYHSDRKTCRCGSPRCRGRINIVS
ncbi:MAG: SET domain-containing protein-lysine N-methyltransferase [Acidobacteria bacterium]|nr:SET domain-containing protein-lysine N-methyltransferase [Acidobacteriota bacterium]